MRIRRGELVGGVSGLGLLAVTFLPWFSAGGERLNAWEAFGFIDIVLVLAAATAVTVGLVVLTQASVSLPVAGSAATVGIGGLAFVLVLYRLIDPPGGAGVGREIGVWLGLLAAAGITYGGYEGMQEEGVSYETEVR